MSLLQPGRKGGNPAWQKGVSQNPAGRPKGKFSGIKNTLRRLKRDPIEELIGLADLARASKDYATAIAIWRDIHDEDSSFPSLMAVEKEKKTTAQKLEDLERGANGGTGVRPGSTPVSVGAGKAPVQVAASTEADISSDPK